jgi:hypothetical protein
MPKLNTILHIAITYTIIILAKNFSKDLYIVYHITNIINLHAVHKKHIIGTLN